MALPKMTTKQKGTILGVALAAASIILGATGVDISSFSQPNNLEPRIQALERARIADSVSLQSIQKDVQETRDDVRYMRGRLDNIADKQR